MKITAHIFRFSLKVWKPASSINKLDNEMCLLLIWASRAPPEQAIITRCPLHIHIQIVVMTCLVHFRTSKKGKREIIVIFDVFPDDSVRRAWNLIIAIRSCVADFVCRWTARRKWIFMSTHIRCDYEYFSVLWYERGNVWCLFVGRWLRLSCYRIQKI